MRILLVSQMYPGPDAPDLGTFVAEVERELLARGHDVDRAVLHTRAGGRLRYAALAGKVLRARAPDVVYAHFLVPAGLIALAGRAPLVVTAHGRDVRNVGAIPGIAAATRLVVRRAAAVVCVSGYLRRELETKVPEAAGKTEVVSDAYAQLGEGTLTFAGDGPLLDALTGRPGVTLVGRVALDAVPPLIAESHVVCQPSLLEPLGQSLLEGMACGRSVVATRVGGPPELVPPEAGLLVDPLDCDAIAEAMHRAAAMPRPNEAARAAASEHDVRRQAERIEAILSRAAGRRA